MKVSGKDLKKAIKTAGFTQEIAADMLRISRRTLNNWYDIDDLDEDIVYKVERILQLRILAETDVKNIHKIEKEGKKGSQTKRNRNVTIDETKPLGNISESPSMGYNRVKAEGINQQLSSHLLYTRFEEMVERQQEQIIQLLTTTRLLKDELKMLKSV